MVHTGSEDPFVELKDHYRDYKVFDGHYERIGKVNELFVDEADNPVYLGVSTGILDAGSVLIPMDIVRINDKRGVVEVDTSRNRIEGAPSLVSGDEVSPEVEDKVRIYYGLRPLHSSSREHDDARMPESGTDERVDLIPGEREADHRRFESDPPHIERGGQLRRNLERGPVEQEAPERGAAERSTGLRGPTDARRGMEMPRDESGNRGEPTATRVRRFVR